MQRGIKGMSTSHEQEKWTREIVFTTTWELISHEHATNFRFACLCKTISSHAKLLVVMQNCDFGTNLNFFLNLEDSERPLR